VFFFFFNVFLGDRDGSVRALSTTCVSVFHGNFYLRSTVKIAFLSSQALG
jgi:hypothetical protein